MEKRTSDLAILALLAAVLVVISAAYVWTAPAAGPSGPAPASSAPTVDERPLQQAQMLAGMAEGDTETRLAQRALTLSDHEVDAAFSTAIRQATREAQQHPANPASADRRRLSACEAAVSEDQREIAAANSELAHARATRRDALDQEVAFLQAELSLDQDELADAQRDCARSVGDPRDAIQRMMALHAAVEHSDATIAAHDRANLDQARGLIARIRAYDAIGRKQKLLAAATADSRGLAATLNSQHDALEKIATAARQAVRQSTSTDTAAKMKAVALISGYQKTLGDYDQRIEAAQQLGDIYRQWSGAVAVEHRAAVHLLLQSAFWILAILSVLFIADRIVEGIFARVDRQRKRLLRLRHVFRLVCEIIGAFLVAVVLFGPPQQLTTIVGLAGAGLTIALQDPILSFLGWLVLMGRHGASIGDRVEIEGINGDVVEIGLLRTILLERTEAGPPTGREVSFPNSFALRGHFLNFSTTGQWLFDEMSLPLPPQVDPQAVARDAEALVKAATAADTAAAEAEWRRISQRYSHRSIPAAPIVEVRHTGNGAELAVAYVTSAAHRREMRTALTRELLQMLKQPSRRTAAEA